MAAIDGQFDEELNLTAGNKNVVAAGTLDVGFEDLDLTLHVVVVDKKGSRRRGRGQSTISGATPEPPSDWSTEVVRGQGAGTRNNCRRGRAIAYATALGTGPEGIKSWQWHSVVTLKAEP